MWYEALNKNAKVKKM